MKFINSSNFTSGINTYIKRLGRTFMMPVTTVMRKGKNMTQPNSIAKKATAEVMEQVKQLKQPPKSIKAYVAFGDHYVAKRLLYLLLVFLLVLPALLINFAFPAIQSRYLVKTMPVDAEGIANYSGKVKLTDRKT
ncbi:MAG: hypothetical protein RR590_05275, partial [Hungatella sp.]